MGKKVIAYTRVSKVQESNEWGLDAQRTRLEGYALAMGLEVVEWVVDNGYSAKDTNRPGLQRALNLLDEGKAEALLVCKLDRLTRNLRDLLDLVDRYFRTHTLISFSDMIDTATASGRLVLNILGAVGQWERETISERTKEGLAEAKRQGRIPGCKPYSDEGTLELIRELRARGEGLKVIAARLETLGAPSPRGVWTAKSVGRLVGRAEKQGRQGASGQEKV